MRIRPDSILHAIPVAQWTPEEVMAHLEETFRQACDQRPDLMEPYLIRLEGTNETEQKAIMREGLRDTFNRRHPSRLRKRQTP
jgi:hypothetical protein